MKSGHALCCDRRDKPARLKWAVTAILVLHAALLAWGAWQHSPAYDEVAYLPAGISHWQLGRFDLCRVTPPLGRMLAAIPVVLSGPETDWSRYDSSPTRRPRFSVGKDFITANGAASFWYFTLARWACIPLSVLGGYFCYRWATDLYGAGPGLLALLLWCLSPNILAHGQLMTPDMAGTALGLTAAYFFWRWLRARSWSSACAAGMILGLAELARTTWVVLFAIWPVLWVLYRWPDRRELRLSGWLREATMLFGLIVLSVYVINLGYCFEGSFQELGQYHFQSRVLAGSESDGNTAHQSDNRFNRTWLGMLPVPLPMNYVQGIDAQKRDFERKMPSYLRGEWRVGGWWYYYLYALAIKVPLGTWLIVFLALLVRLFRPRHSASWRDEIVLLAPAAVVLTLVSSQTGINQHMRYVLPAFPFVFVWASKVAGGVNSNAGKVRWIVAVALLWSATSSLWIYPHSLSYFNELVGGPMRGHAHLHDSNIDWGQDLLYLKRWLDEHPEARPLHLRYFLPLVDPRIAGIESTPPPPGPSATAVSGYHLDEEHLGPQPGWHALSTNEIRSRSKRYSYFLHFKPVAMAGYSIYIYHISCDQANHVRKELGLSDSPRAEEPDERANDDQIR